MKIIENIWWCLIILWIVLVGIAFHHIDTKENDWWAKSFCLMEDGKLQQKFFKDICWINGIGYIADFVGTGEYYSDLIPSDEIYEWQLVEVLR